MSKPQGQSLDDWRPPTQAELYKMGDEYTIERQAREDEKTKRLSSIMLHGFDPDEMAQRLDSDEARADFIKWQMTTTVPHMVTIGFVMMLLDVVEKSKHTK